MSNEYIWENWGEKRKFKDDISETKGPMSDD